MLESVTLFLFFKGAVGRMVQMLTYMWLICILIVLIAIPNLFLV